MSTNKLGDKLINIISFDEFDESTSNSYRPLTHSRMIAKFRKKYYLYIIENEINGKYLVVKFKMVNR
jgi:hypothetical protein